MLKIFKKNLPKKPEKKPANSNPKISQNYAENTKAKRKRSKSAEYAKKNDRRYKCKLSSHSTENRTKRMRAEILRLTGLVGHLDAPVFGVVICTLVAPSRPPFLRLLVPNHPTSLPLRDALHASILFPPSRLLWRRNLPHQTHLIIAKYDKLASNHLPSSLSRKSADKPRT